MNRIIATFKKLRVRQVLMTFLAGVLLFVSTACTSGPAQAKNPLSGNPRPEVPGGTATSPDSSIKNTYKGSMNDFSDVDPRAKNMDSTKNQAEALKKNAERNIEEKSVDSPQQYVRNYREGTPLGERVKNLGKDVKGSTQEITEDVSKGTQRGTEKVKSNAADATKDVTRGANRAADNVKQSAEDAASSVNRSTNRAAENVKGAANDLGRSANRAADDVKGKANELGRDASRAVDNATGDVKAASKDNVSKAQESSKSAIDKAGDAIKNILD